MEQFSHYVSATSHWGSHAMTNTETYTIDQVGETLVSDHCIFAKKKKKK